MAAAFRRWPPAGEAIPPSAIWSAFSAPDPARALIQGLEERLGSSRVTLHGSGRQALRLALEHLARSRDRDEVLIPAYTCFSVPAAAVAAGLRVRLVDVTREGRIDRSALEALPLERAAALVVSNLFWVPEPIADIREPLARAGVAVVDDAAQAFGTDCGEGPVGSRGDLGILSFGRGKPLSGLGGGAIIWPDSPEAAPEPPGLRRASALARAVLYDVALQPAVFRVLAAIPALGIGETHFDPDITPGPIDGASVCLAAAALQGFDRSARERADRAASLSEEIAATSAFSPICGASDAACGYPRLAVVAPGAKARDAALSALCNLGATAMYPSALDQLAALQPHRVGESSCPGAQELAARVLTLPTNRALRGAERARLLDTLRTLS
jgi:dTDP-4-amino-4,6-dideoxygalactose transaminase